MLGFVPAPPPNRRTGTVRNSMLRVVQTVSKSEKTASYQSRSEPILWNQSRAVSRATAFSSTMR
ncbi:hypothetical protein GGR04_003619 [Aureimonas pseudogalii]|uniref:Uncharacterized protein n=1 Tax=Aureimonas pseudogalii TaxID=1744844 RepID=A0A7W6MLG5_9HYPH|nr:hypothetical protein [Aureimonas pseudogalii]